MKKRIIALLTAAMALTAMFPSMAGAATIDTHDIFFEAEDVREYGEELLVQDQTVGTQSYENLTNASATGKVTNVNVMNVRALENVVGSEGKVTFQFTALSAGMYTLTVYGTPARNNYNVMSKVSYSVNGSEPIKMICGDPEQEDTVVSTDYDANINLAKNTALVPVELKEGKNTVTFILDSSKLNSLQRIFSYIDCVGFTKVEEEDPYELNLTHEISDAAVAADGTGVFRFITKFNLTGDAPEVEAFGTYIIPETVFEDDNMLADGAIVTYTEEASEIKDGDTYTADLIKIPPEYFGEKLYAMSYVKFAGEDDVHFFNIVIDSDTAQCVNDFIE